MNRNRERKRLLHVYDKLPEREREMLCAFAEFLLARLPPESKPLARPEPIPRPAQESVVAALKRLSASYPMLDKSKMLHETSALMSQHVLQGRAANLVIDELEVIFQRHYAVLADDRDGETP